MEGADHREGGDGEVTIEEAKKNLEIVLDSAENRCARNIVIPELEEALKIAIGFMEALEEYKAKVNELEDAIARCEQAEKEFNSRTCKFRSPINCDFCAFYSDCEEHWKEGDEK